MKTRQISLVIALSLSTLVGSAFGMGGKTNQETPEANGSVDITSNTGIGLTGRSGQVYLVTAQNGKILLNDCHGYTVLNSPQDCQPERQVALTVDQFESRIFCQMV